MTIIYKKKFQFSLKKDKIFQRFFNIVLLDLDKTSTTLSSSFTNPAGTVFLSEELYLGKSLTKKIIFTKYEKPNIFEYLIKSKNDEITITYLFDEIIKDHKQKTNLIYIVNLKKKNFLFHFKKRKIANEMKRKLDYQIKYTQKIIF